MHLPYLVWCASGCLYVYVHGSPVCSVLSLSLYDRTTLYIRTYVYTSQPLLHRLTAECIRTYICTFYSVLLGPAIMICLNGFISLLLFVLIISIFVHMYACVSAETSCCPYQTQHCQLIWEDLQQPNPCDRRQPLSQFLHTSVLYSPFHMATRNRFGAFTCALKLVSKRFYLFHTDSASTEPFVPAHTCWGALGGLLYSPPPGNFSSHYSHQAIYTLPSPPFCCSTWDLV